MQEKFARGQRVTGYDRISMCTCSYKGALSYYEIFTLYMGESFQDEPSILSILHNEFIKFNKT